MILDKNIKIGIVMPYFNRQFQLNKTIETINNQNYKNLFVVIVDDNSDDEIILPDCNFKVKIIRIGDEKQWTNPEPAYNKGIDFLLKNTDSEILIIQNPECYHVGNVLDFTANNVTKENYITFGCYSIDKNNTFNTNFNVVDFINTLGNNKAVQVDFTNGWYNHSIHRPVGYEFCAAIHISNIIKLNGYDERLAFGCGYGDNYLLHRIKLLGLNYYIIDSPFVVHQYHENSIKNNKTNLVNKNREIYLDLIKSNDIRGVHLFTDDF